MQSNVIMVRDLGCHLRVSRRDRIVVTLYVETQNKTIKLNLNLALI